MDLMEKQMAIATIFYEEGDMEYRKEAEQAAEAFINWSVKVNAILNLEED